MLHSEISTPTKSDSGSSDDSLIISNVLLGTRYITLANDEKKTENSNLVVVYNFSIWGS